VWLYKSHLVKTSEHVQSALSFLKDAWWLTSVISEFFNFEPGFPIQMNENKNDASFWACGFQIYREYTHSINNICINSKHAIMKSFKKITRFEWEVWQLVSIHIFDGCIQVGNLCKNHTFCYLIECVWNQMFATKGKNSMRLCNIIFNLLQNNKV